MGASKTRARRLSILLHKVSGHLLLRVMLAPEDHPRRIDGGRADCIVERIGAIHQHDDAAKVLRDGVEGGFELWVGMQLLGFGRPDQDHGNRQRQSKDDGGDDELFLSHGAGMVTIAWVG